LRINFIDSSIQVHGLLFVAAKHFDLDLVLSKLRQSASRCSGTFITTKCIKQFANISIQFLWIDMGLIFPLSFLSKYKRV